MYFPAGCIVLFAPIGVFSRWLYCIICAYWCIFALVLLYYLRQLVYFRGRYGITLSQYSLKYVRENTPIGANNTIQPARKYTNRRK
jgi:hypothetical protein